MTGLQGSAILLLLATFFARSITTPIWRCPSFKLLPCKTLPLQCLSYRMIYIRHVHLECPACLICADPWGLKPWSAIVPTTTNAASTKETRRQRRRRLKRKMRRGEKGRPQRQRSPKEISERLKRRRKRRKERQRLAAEAVTVASASSVVATPKA